MKGIARLTVTEFVINGVNAETVATEANTNKVEFFISDSTIARFSCKDVVSCQLPVASIDIADDFIQAKSSVMEY